MLRIRYESYIGIFRPIGTISDVVERSSAECSADDSIIPCFPESVAEGINKNECSQDMRRGKNIWHASVFYIQLV